MNEEEANEEEVPIQPEPPTPEPPHESWTPPPKSPNAESPKREKIKPANCPHKTITTNRRTGQARCYSCGKWMPNALLSKFQQRLDKFMETE